jgi:SAM-dependent methyltransferase
VDADLLATFADIQWTHWWFRGRRAVLDDVLARRLGGPPSRRNLEVQRVLEVGCGTGAMVPVLAKYGAVTGMDPSGEAVAECKAQFPEHTFVKGTVPDDVPDETFDLVAALDVLEHIDDDVGALRRLGDALAPGGLLLLTVPAYRWLWGPHDEINHHVRRYTRRTLRAAVTNAGFEVERTTYFNSILFPAAAVVRLGRRYFARHQEPTADLAVTGRRANEVMARMFAAERRPLRHVDLPFGVSVLALARRR